MPANEYYLISKSLAEDIWDALKDKYSSWPPTGYTSPEPYGENIPALIAAIESVAPGTSVSPITINGTTSITKIWIGDSLSCPSSRDSDTIYIITDGNS